MKLDFATKEQIPLIQELYMQSFPSEERKPFTFMQKGQKKGRFQILALTEAEEVQGLVITVLDGDIVLVDYLAIKPSKRNNGIGSEAISLIMKRFEGKRVFLEIEIPEEGADNLEQRLKRKQFYLKNGFKENGIRVSLFGVRMEVLTYQCDINFQEYCHVYVSTIGKLMAKLKVKRLQ